MEKTCNWLRQSAPANEQPLEVKSRPSPSLCISIALKPEAVGTKLIHAAPPTRARILTAQTQRKRQWLCDRQWLKQKLNASHPKWRPQTLRSATLSASGLSVRWVVLKLLFKIWQRTFVLLFWALRETLLFFSPFLFIFLHRQCLDRAPVPIIMCDWKEQPSTALFLSWAVMKKWWNNKRERERTGGNVIFKKNRLLCVRGVGGYWHCMLLWRFKMGDDMATPQMSVTFKVNDYLSSELNTDPTPSFLSKPGQSLSGHLFSFPSDISNAVSTGS